MRQYLFSRRSLGLGVAIAAFVALPVQAASAADATTSCPDPLLSQPFQSWGDSNWYTLTPGEDVDNVDATGWVLSDGAKIVTTTLADGNTGSVLDLPPGSSATTPTMCVESGMPLARMITQMVGGPKSNATVFQVWNADGTTLGGAMGVLGSSSWALSPPVNVAPGSFSGSKQVYFTFTNKGKAGDLQLYDLYVDPRMRC